MCDFCMIFKYKFYSNVILCENYDRINNEKKY